MNKTGLTSITFRNLSVEEVIEIVKDANLDAIEWGSDVHVLPGDLETATHVKSLMDKAGIVTSSYGSYYRVGIKNEYSFEDVLASAKALGAEDIRVWAGRKGSLDADAEYRKSVEEDSYRIAEMASLEGIRVSYEYHGKTLTDTPESALNLLKTVNHPNMYLYWQPAVDLPVEQRLEDIENVKGYITNVHVFSWNVIDRLPISDKFDSWKKYVQSINEDKTIETRYFLIEFVKDDSVEQFKEDAQTLIELVK